MTNVLVFVLYVHNYIPDLCLPFIDQCVSCVYQVTELATVKRPQERSYALQRWHDTGGVMIIGYEMYRNLTQGRNIKSKKLKEIFQRTLVDPGTVLCNAFVFKLPLKANKKLEKHPPYI